MFSVLGEECGQARACGVGVGGGHGLLFVLLATYARCIEGQLDDLKQRIEGAGELPDSAALGA